MSLTMKRSRRATRSYVDITRVVRTSYNRWDVSVEYMYGRKTWTESVTFTRVPVTRRLDHITIKDRDYPADRSMVIVVDRASDMVTTITNFLIAGRW